MLRLIKFVDEQGKKVGEKPATTSNRYLAAVSSMYRQIEVLGGYPGLSPMVSYKGRRPIEMMKSFLVHTVNQAQHDTIKRKTSIFELGAGRESLEHVEKDIRKYFFNLSISVSPVRCEYRGI